MGGKDKGTRFLSYVEAIHGFRHLLTQEDLDRAMSLCVSLKGHLKSRFLVLSDDRILPPYQGNRGKRAHPDDADNDAASGKRTHHDAASRATPRPPTGNSVVATPSSSFAAIVSSQASATPLTSYVPTVSSQHVVGFPAPAHGVASGQSFLPFGYACPPGVQPQAVPGVSGVVPIAAPMSLAPAGISGQDSAAMGAQLLPMSSVLMQFPPPSVAQPQGQATGLPVGVVSGSPAYKTVKSRRSNKSKVDKSKIEKTDKTTIPTRLTPSRKAKGKPGPKESSGANEVTSPVEDYESCASDDETSTEMVQQ